MKQKEYLELIADLFDFKTIKDQKDNEYVIYKTSTIENIEGIEDKTQFEAIENHVHLLDKVRKDDFQTIDSVMKNLGEAMLSSLKNKFPEKEFVVYVTVSLNDSLIIRFHQKWEDEEPYYGFSDSETEKEKIFCFC